MNQLRMAIEKKKQTLIESLIHVGAIPPTDKTIYTLTLSELDNLLKQSLKKTSKQAR
jgi:hypothetical protein